MTLDPVVTGLALLALGAVAGVQVVARATATQRASLLPGLGLLHGAVLLGAVVVTGTAGSPAAVAGGLVAVALATAGLVAGCVLAGRVAGAHRRRARGEDGAAR